MQVSSLNNYKCPSMVYWEKYLCPLKNTKFSNIIYFNNSDTFVKYIQNVGEAKNGISQKGLDFGRELVKISQKPNFSYKNVQELVNKYVPNNNIKIHPMSDYTKFGVCASNPNDVAAVTRPTFDKNGVLEKIDLFIPEINSRDKEKYLEFIEKTTHEFTHILQFVNDKKIIDSQFPDGPGKFLNFVEKKISDYFTKTVIFESSKKFIIENKYSVKSGSDYNKFLDKTIDKPISEEDIRVRANLPKDKAQFKDFFHKYIFNDTFNSIMQAMKYQQNPDVKILLNRYGSYDNLREKIKEISKDRMIKEYEAWSTGKEIRKEILGIKGKNSYNDIIPLIFKFTAEAL